MARWVTGSLLAGAAGLIGLFASSPLLAQADPPPRDTPESAPPPRAVAPAPPQGSPPPSPPAQAPPGYGQSGYPYGQPGYQQPGYPPPGYAPPGYQQPGYPPPGYAPPGYAPYPPGYPPPGYAPPGYYPSVGPARMDYVEGEPIPQGYRVETRVRRGAVLAGALMAGITYGINLFIAGFENGDNSSDWLYVPVVGGWVYASDVCDGDGCSFLVLHNLTHSAGVVLLIYGLAARRKVLVRNDVGFSITPAKVGSGSGVVVRGTF